MELLEARNIFEKVANVKKELRIIQFKKTGKNNFGNFNYFNLNDFNPFLQKVLNENGLHVKISFNMDYATLTIINVENPEETDTISLPVPSFDLLSWEIKNKDKKSNINQKIGSTATYLKRYLLQMYFDIDDNDSIDIDDNDSIQKKNAKTTEKSNNKAKSKSNLDKAIQESEKRIAKPKTSKMYADFNIHEWLDKSIRNKKSKEQIRKQYTALVKNKRIEPVTNFLQLLNDAVGEE
jgi:hypothetical protein